MRKKGYIFSIILLTMLSGCCWRKKSCKPYVDDYCSHEVSCPEHCGHNDCDHVAHMNMTSEDDLFTQDLDEMIALSDTSFEDDSIWADAILDQEAQKTVYFDLNDSHLRDDQKEILAYNCELILEEFNRAQREGLEPVLVVEGYGETDEISQNRAQVVADWYADHGVAVDAMKIVPKSNNVMIAQADDATSWESDRVDSWVTYN